MYANNAKAAYEVRKGNESAELPVEEDVKIFRQYCVQEIKRLYVKNLMMAISPLPTTSNCRYFQHWEGVEDTVFPEISALLEISAPF